MEEIFTIYEAKPQGGKGSFLGKAVGYRQAIEEVQSYNCDCILQFNGDMLEYVHLCETDKILKHIS